VRKYLTAITTPVTQFTRMRPFNVAGLLGMPTVVRKTMRICVPRTSSLISALSKPKRSNDPRSEEHGVMGQSEGVAVVQGHSEGASERFARREARQCSLESHCGGASSRLLLSATRQIRLSNELDPANRGKRRTSRSALPSTPLSCATLPFIPISQPSLTIHNRYPFLPMTHPKQL
jgi:hypothetical protein